MSNKLVPEPTFEKEWEFETIISTEFNRLKAKLFNLAETTIKEETQLKAFKGLVKDFCNEEYIQTILQMRTFMIDMGHVLEESFPITSEPLENR